MNTKSIYKIARYLSGFICCIISMQAFAQEDSAKPSRQSLLNLRYYVIDNQVPYLTVQTKNKIGKAFQPAAKVPVTLYLNNDVDKGSLIGQVITNEKGVATIGLPPNLATQWNEKSSPTFYAHTDSTSSFNAATVEILMNKSRLELDTINEAGTRSVKARLFKVENNAMVPIAGVDVKLAVKRLGGYLNIGEEETYTTDSTGSVQGEFTSKQLPGDSKGSIQLVALVDDNDEVGTLETKSNVVWGVPSKYENTFDNRTLFATGNKAPVWLMVMAYGIIAAVWTVIFILIANIIQIRKLGTRVK